MIEEGNNPSESDLNLSPPESGTEDENANLRLVVERLTQALEVMSLDLEDLKSVSMLNEIRLGYPTELGNLIAALIGIPKADNMNIYKNLTSNNPDELRRYFGSDLRAAITEAVRLDQSSEMADAILNDDDLGLNFMISEVAVDIYRGLETSLTPIVDHEKEKLLKTAAKVIADAVRSSVKYSAQRTLDKRQYGN